MFLTKQQYCLSKNIGDDWEKKDVLRTYYVPLLEVSVRECISFFYTVCLPKKWYHEKHGRVFD